MASTAKSIKLYGEGDTLIIEWADGHRSAYSYRYLRDHCPCATCTDSGSSLDHPTAELPVLGQKPLKPLKADLVGRYALQIYWNDAHSTGIYTFDYLRDLCPCTDCEAARDKVT